ncbi:MAG: hypothetical protein NTV51_14415 [Verrucomicrobia bacterium]|nr:hypothetical protein [Verrucomicrobiota bacterium]
MISSASSPDRAARPDLVSQAGPSSPRPYTPRPDQISTDSADYLRGALQRQPAVRPEVVERARAMVADPNYPSPEIIKRVAEQIVASPDLSEVDS